MFQTYNSKMPLSTLGSLHMPISWIVLIAT